MNILLLTLCRITDINERGIYSDLIRELSKCGHLVHVVASSERRYRCKTGITEQLDVKLLNVNTLNIQKTNFIEKGIGTILIEHQYKKAINKYFSDIKFDLLIYSTPPITLTNVISSIKKRTGASSYLLLKDIFPQNAVDLGMMGKNGLLYRFFRHKEKRLYELSDYIGCMSPTNVEYLLSHNKFIDNRKVEVCPNSIEIAERKADGAAEQNLRDKYNIPANSTVFIYGGNLGKPQGVDFLLEVLESNIKNEKVFFLIVGSGTGFPAISSWFEKNLPRNAELIPSLPVEEYNQLVSLSDVGMIFLDRRFTIPNYPSRLLAYLEFKKPVLMAIDTSTDLGRIAEDNNYGFWSESGDIEEFNKNLSKFVEDSSLIKTMGEAGYDFLLKNYTVDITCSRIMQHFPIS